MPKHTNPIMNRLEQALQDRKASGLYRSLAEPMEVWIDLSTNSYLSLHTNRDVIDNCRIQSDTHSHGNLASRLISCHSPLYQTLEKELAQWKNTESALLFNSGYAANIGTIQALCTKNTEVFCDKYNHASIIDGIRLSGAVMTRYLHCDMDDLARKMKVSSHQEKIIVTDTVFSMDGDTAPLASICELAQRNDAMIMIDEAHASGIFGDTLSGLAQACHVENKIDIRISTLSKAFAGIGGFVATTGTIREYLVNNARSLIYSTGLPHSSLVWNHAALQYIRNNPHLGSEVLMLAERFRQGLRSIGFDTGASEAHIVPCIVGDPQKAVSLSRYLLEHKIKAPAIRPPTVPPGTARLRFSISREFTEEKQDAVLYLLTQWKTYHA